MESLGTYFSWFNKQNCKIPHNAPNKSFRIYFLCLLQSYTNADLKISVYVCVHIKTIHTENLASLILRILGLFVREFVNLLESRLFFNIFQCFWTFVKKTFHIFHVSISQKVKGVLMWNLQHIIFIRRPRYW